MDFRVHITQPALADFQAILEYSWSNFPDSAERFGNAILNHLELLQKYPYIGSPVVDRPNVRQLVHTPILIYYRVNEARGRVDVLHFWHANRSR